MIRVTIRNYERKEKRHPAGDDFPEDATTGPSLTE